MADEQDRRKRAMTDEDVRAIVDLLEERLTNKFYLDLGRGVWGLAWRAVVAVVVLVAAYGGFTRLTGNE